MNNDDWLFPPDADGEIITNTEKQSVEKSPKVLLEIRNHSKLTDTEKKLLDLSLLESFGSVEVWTACGTNQQLAYSTHGMFRYFGKFPPPIATHIISSYAGSDGVIFDPMCGSGTTGVEALLSNHKCVLNDINPLSVLLAKVKTTSLLLTDIQASLMRIYARYKPLSFNEYNFEPSFLRNYNHWFLPETVDSLRGLRFLIEQEKNSDIKDFLRICFAASVRKVSRATTQQGRLFLDAASAEKDALATFRKKAETAMIGVAQLPQNRRPEIYSFDLRKDFPKELHDFADVVICHPPYFNSYKYSSINSLELAWLDVDYSHLRSNEIREFFKVGKEENAKHYISDMTLTLVNLHKSIRKDGVLALMIGDTVIHGTYIPVTQQILKNISSYYSVKTVALRAPKYTEAAWVASQRREQSQVGIKLYDFVIILKKI